MTVIATALKHMLAAGLDHEAILTAVADMETGLMAALSGVAAASGGVTRNAGERSANAERQARWRERDKQKKAKAGVTDNATRNAGDNACDVTPVTAEPFPSPASSFPPDPQTNSTPTHTRKDILPARKGRGSAGDFHRMPDGWMPTKPLPPKLAAAVVQWPTGKLENEIEALRDWAANAEDKNGKGRKLDWDIALHGWLRRADNDWRSRNGNDRSGRNNRPGNGAAYDFIDACRDVFDPEASDPFAHDGGGMPLLEGMGRNPSH